MLYSCDAAWWDASGPTAAEFAGERWSSHSESKRVNDNKSAAAERHGLKLVEGDKAEGFCLTPGRVHYGDNSGFQAINLAIQFGASQIWLIGFDMQHTNKRHFFGDHPPECAKDSNYRHFIGHFDAAARLLPPDVHIINATPSSALTCFPRGNL